PQLVDHLEAAFGLELQRDQASRVAAEVDDGDGLHAASIARARGRARLRRARLAVPDLACSVRRGGTGSGATAWCAPTSADVLHVPQRVPALVAEEDDGVDPHGGVGRTKHRGGEVPGGGTDPAEIGRASCRGRMYI